MGQRVMIAMMLIAEPDLLIADEPTSALDVTVQLAGARHPRRAGARARHGPDLHHARPAAGRVLLRPRDRHVCRQGRRGAAGVASCATRQHPYTRGLLNCLPQDRRRPPSAAGARPQAGVGGMSASAFRDRRSWRSSSAPTIRALNGVSFDVRAGESFGLVGESGSGKSTVLRAISGLAPVWSGSITVNGKTLGARRDKAFYRAVQMVFQDPYGSLHPRQTVDRLLPSRSPSTASPTANSASSGRCDEVGLGPRLPLPLPAPALRRPAPARRDRPRADPRAVDPAARRADLGARRLGAGRGAEPAGRGAAAAQADLPDGQPRSRGHHPHVRAADGDAERRSGGKLTASQLIGHRVEKDYTRNLLRASEGFVRTA